MSEVKKITISIPNFRNNEKNEKNEKNKKRVESEKWKFNIKDYDYEKQMKIIINADNNGYKFFEDIVSKTICQQINKKIYGYKQQDIIKDKFNEKIFINMESIIRKMIECELKCYYCLKEMLVLYDISREMTQWSVDRIDNDKGHNVDNFYLACLECNLKRRRRNDDKFLFTKQLKLIKIDDSLIN